MVRAGVPTGKRKGSESNLLEGGSVALTASEGSQSSGSGDKRQIFTDAEQKIIEKAWRWQPKQLNCKGSSTR